MDVVSKLQREVLSLSQQLGGTIEVVTQSHAPPSAPPPPEGRDHNHYYEEYWRKRNEEEPFRTLGFVDSSEEAFNDLERWEKMGSQIVNTAKSIEELLKDPLFATTDEEQDKQLAELLEENLKVEQELKETEQQATQILKEMREIHHNTAAEYLRTNANFNQKTAS